MTSSRTETLVDVTMPQMGVSVAEGTVVAWRVGVGDAIEAEQTICEISTDKIDTEVPAPVSGVVTEILVDVDQTVEVGTVMARIAVEGGVAADAGDARRRMPTRRRRLRRRPERPSRPRRASRPRPLSADRRGRTHPGAATPRWWRGSPPSTTSTSRRWRGPAAAGGCASRMCWPWSTATAVPAARWRSRRCTSRAHTGPIRPRPQPPQRPGRLEAGCRGCAARSASA